MLLASVVSCFFRLDVKCENLYNRKHRTKEEIMRVIAGKARRLALKTVPGMETRPTTDRIKETLFNMIQDELYGIRFLDLFFRERCDRD